MAEQRYKNPFTARRKERESGWLEDAARGITSGLPKAAAKALGGPVDMATTALDAGDWLLKKGTPLGHRTPDISPEEPFYGSQHIYDAMGRPLEAQSGELGDVGRITEQAVEATGEAVGSRGLGRLKKAFPRQTTRQRLHHLEQEQQITQDELDILEQAASIASRIRSRGQRDPLENITEPDPEISGHDIEDVSGDIRRSEDHKQALLHLLQELTRDFRSLSPRQKEIYSNLVQQYKRM